MTSPPPQNNDKSAGWAIGGLGLAMVACCALPLLIVGGALGGFGALLGNPWVLGAAALILAVGLARWLRRSSSPSGEGCCPPPPQPEQPEVGSEPPNRRQEP